MDIAEARPLLEPVASERTWPDTHSVTRCDSPCCVDISTLTLLSDGVKDLNICLGELNGRVDVIVGEVAKDALNEIDSDELGQDCEKHEWLLCCGLLKLS